jgi:hypothetical protein
MDELISAIRGWNPWWNLSWNFPPTIYRDMTDKITSFLKVPHIKDIIGIRRSGKSTVMTQLIDNRIKEDIKPDSMILLNFEDPVIKNTEFIDIQNAIFLINPNINFLFLDEIQEKSFFQDRVHHC